MSQRAKLQEYTKKNLLFSKYPSSKFVTRVSEQQIFFLHTELYTERFFAVYIYLYLYCLYLFCKQQIGYFKSNKFATNPDIVVMYNFVVKFKFKKIVPNFKSMYL